MNQTSTFPCLLTKGVCHERVSMKSGNKVNTDRRDSRKLARLLESSLLKRVYVLSEEDRGDREFLRTWRQILEHRSEVARQIKSKL